MFLTGKIILMKRPLTYIALVLCGLYANASFCGDGLQVDPKFAKVTDRCKTKNPTKQVFLIKQWHLAPGVNTKDSPAKELPQKENQTSIYKQIDRWVSAKKLHTLLAEGCSGEIDSNFNKAFNGWKYSDLKAKAASKNYPEIISHVPLKIEAKFGERINTICADDDGLIKETGLAFSDARGTLGFYSRISQYKNDSNRVKPYLQSAIEVFKLPADTTSEQALVVLKKELQSSVSRIEKSLEMRNRKMVEAIKAVKDKLQVLVVGGAHVSHIAQMLEKENIGCTMIEPKGYSQDEEKTLSSLRKLIEAN